MLPIAYIASQLKYEPDTGKLYWQVTRNRIVAGQEAGSRHLGYIRVKMKGRNYAAHRIAWALTFGDWPSKEIDHIDGDRANNRISNLREATHSQNIQNCILRNSNKYGLRGIYKQTCAKGWGATISVNGQRKYLGTFSSAEEAHAAYLDAVIKFHGKFANTTTANHKENPMSRKSSVVLSPAEKKAALKAAKDALKAAQAYVKELDKQANALAKIRAGENKAAEKAAAAAAKALEKAQADVDALTAE